MSLSVDDNSKRRDIHKRKPEIEASINRLNKEIVRSPSSKLTLPQMPITLIMGSARCGSTLLFDYLSKIGCFSYPTNFISRFYKNPKVGILSQDAVKDLFYFNYNNVKYVSNLGKIDGAFEPSEFWYYWRHHFSFDSETNRLIKNNSSVIEFLDGLACFDEFYRKPLIMKGMMLNYDISYLHNSWNKFIFIHLKRDVIRNALSLLKARISFYENIKLWYSFKIPEYEKLSKLDVYDQVIHQVICNNNAISAGFDQLPYENKISVSYEEFCQDPAAIYDELSMRYATHGVELDKPSIERSYFETTDIKDEDLLHVERLNIALAKNQNYE